MKTEYAIKNENTLSAVEQAYGFDKQFGDKVSSGTEDFIEYETYDVGGKASVYFFVNDKLVGYKPWQ